MRRDTGQSQAKSEAEPGAAEEAVVAVERLEAFLRQLSHDVRNDLNAMDLLTSYVEDLQPIGSVREALGQLHDSVRYGSKRMLRLSRFVQKCESECIPYPSDLLFEDFRSRFKREKPLVFPRTVWERRGARIVVPLDPELVMEALVELLDNALGFSPADSTVQVELETQSDGVLWRFTQSSTSCASGIESWGKRPLESSRPPHYGIGLFRARRIIAAHRGWLRFDKEKVAAALLSEVFFPRKSS